jgi:antitoxin ParD1/3/4
MATMNISLTDKLKTFVESNVESGDYGNASEYVRDLIRKEQERVLAIAEIQKLIDEGEASGYLPYDRENIERRLGIGAVNKHAA